MIVTDKLTETFTTLTGATPRWISRAPGRVNLIGEHTDYNGGYVLPAAIGYDIKMAAAPSEDATTRLHSANYNESFEYDTSAPLPRPEVTHWYSYWLAVVQQFQARGVQVPALSVAMSGDVPLGAGLSSSAALEVCAATLINEITGAGLPPRDIALLGQAAEHSEYVGVRCGIMDQFASALGRDSHALLLDCHTLDYETVPFHSGDAAIVIINTNKSRDLRTSEFNTRRAECEAGLRQINELDRAEYETLRHVPAEVYARHAAALPEKVNLRVKHNITENERVHEFVSALKAADWATAGELLYASHASLRDDYEVSCAELDAIVEIARESGLVYGCRMTGGGFGGCAVALVPPANVEKFQSVLTPEYTARTGLTPTVYVSRPADGAEATAL